MSWKLSPLKLYVLLLCCKSHSTIRCGANGGSLQVGQVKAKIAQEKAEYQPGLLKIIYSGMYKMFELLGGEPVADMAGFHCYRKDSQR